MTKSSIQTWSLVLKRVILPEIVYRYATFTKERNMRKWNPSTFTYLQFSTLGTLSQVEQRRPLWWSRISKIDELSVIQLLKISLQKLLSKPPTLMLIKNMAVADVNDKKKSSDSVLGDWSTKSWWMTLARTSNHFASPLSACINLTRSLCFQLLKIERAGLRKVRQDQEEEKKQYLHVIAEKQVLKPQRSCAGIAAP